MVHFVLKWYVDVVVCLVGHSGMFHLASGPIHLTANISFCPEKSVPAGLGI